MWLQAGCFDHRSVVGLSPLFNTALWHLVTRTDERPLSSVEYVLVKD